MHLLNHSPHPHHVTLSLELPDDGADALANAALTGARASIFSPGGRWRKTTSATIPRTPSVGGGGPAKGASTKDEKARVAGDAANVALREGGEEGKADGAYYDDGNLLLSSLEALCFGRRATGRGRRPQRQPVAEGGDAVDANSEVSDFGALSPACFTEQGDLLAVFAFLSASLPHAHRHLADAAAVPGLPPRLHKNHRGPRPPKAQHPPGCPRRILRARRGGHREQEANEALLRVPAPADIRQDGAQHEL